MLLHSIGEKCLETYHKPFIMKVIGGFIFFASSSLMGKERNQNQSNGAFDKYKLARMNECILYRYTVYTENVAETERRARVPGLASWRPIRNSPTTHRQTHFTHTHAARRQICRETNARCSAGNQFKNILCAHRKIKTIHYCHVYIGISIYAC